VLWPTELSAPHTATICPHAYHALDPLSLIPKYGFQKFPYYRQLLPTLAPRNFCGLTKQLRPLGNPSLFVFSFCIFVLHFRCTRAGTVFLPYANTSRAKYSPRELHDALCFIVGTQPRWLARRLAARGLHNALNFIKPTLSPTDPLNPSYTRPRK
jgi:hypothetical protein